MKKILLITLCLLLVGCTNKEEEFKDPFYQEPIIVDKFEFSNIEVTYENGISTIEIVMINTDKSELYADTVYFTIDYNENKTIDTKSMLNQTFQANGIMVLRIHIADEITKINNIEYDVK